MFAIFLLTVTILFICYGVFLVVETIILGLLFQKFLLSFQATQFLITVVFQWSYIQFQFENQLFSLIVFQKNAWSFPALPATIQQLCVVAAFTALSNELPACKSNKIFKRR